MAEGKTLDEIRDVAIRIVDELVLEGIIPDCTDTDNSTELDTQDIIVDQIARFLHWRQETLAKKEKV